MKRLSGKRKKYKQYTANGRFRVAKYGMEHGSRRDAKAFQKEFPDLNESTVRTFMKKYVEQRGLKKRLNASSSVVSQAKEEIDQFCWDQLTVK